MEMKKYLIIKNAKQILTLRGFSNRPKIKDEMKDLGIIENGTVICYEDKIFSVRNNVDLRDFEGMNPDLIDWIDAKNKVVMPGFGNRF